MASPAVALPKVPKTLALGPEVKADVPKARSFLLAAIDAAPNDMEFSPADTAPAP